MKRLLSTFLCPSSSVYAGYDKPELLARYSGTRTYQAPAGVSCFGSEPQPLGENVYLACQDREGFRMWKWTTQGAVEVAHTQTGLFSSPKEVLGKIHWYEFSELGVQRAHGHSSQGLTTLDLENLGGLSSMNDSFLALKGGRYVYRSQDDQVRTLNEWRAQRSTPLALEPNSYFFPPVSSAQGDFVFKRRHASTEETAPDELVYWDGELRTILRDEASDPSSPVKAFRHQYALDAGSVALVLTDEQGEAMVILQGGQRVTVARAGRELKSFDYFAPKLRNGVLVFRGVDHADRKVVYVYEHGNLKPLLTQGDSFTFADGEARVSYPQQESIFFGAPGLGADGAIVQQATLSGTGDGAPLLGVGLLRFRRN